ncbi:MAG: hypothetical protein GF411_03790 [Candidatus Lokiarchaeota archaeon]|nr:hypothetical protein [Candidatus Lokiarchaeota archaeon]
MNVVYMKWKEVEGLEEIQVQISSEASGLPAQSNQILPTNMRVHLFE